MLEKNKKSFVNEIFSASWRQDGIALMQFMSIKIG